MILGPGRSETEKSIVMIENGKYQGYGYFEPEFIAVDPEQLETISDLNKTIVIFIVS